MAPVGGSGKESGKALILGGATAGVLELFTFHPIDTIAKRLMTSKEKVRRRGGLPRDGRADDAAPLSACPRPNALVSPRVM